jgi:hypothetical protein
LACSVGSLRLGRKLVCDVPTGLLRRDRSTRKKLAAVAAGRDYPAMHRGWRGHAVGLVAGAWLVAGLCAAGASAATKYPELDQAIVDLKREYGAHVKDPEHEKLRADASYFKKDAATVPPEAVLAVIEKPIPGVSTNDARQAAYVRWQVMSALPETLDEEHARRLLKIYDRAPLPSARYGMSKQEQKELDRLIPAARKEDDVKLTAALEQQAAKAALPDRPVIGLRDELYRRLPLGRDKLVAGITDAKVRLDVAADKETLAELLAEDLTKWTTTPGVDRGQVREVVDLFGKLRMVQSPPYYAFASVQRGKLGWRTHTDTLLAKTKLATLHKQLLDAAAAMEQQPAPAAPGSGNVKKNGSKELSTKKAGTSS